MYIYISHWKILTLTTMIKLSHHHRAPVLVQHLHLPPLPGLTAAPQRLHHSLDVESIREGGGAAPGAALLRPREENLLKLLNHPHHSN